MLRKELPAALHERAIAQFRQGYRNHHRRLVRVFDGIPQMLEALRARKIPMAIMTGKGRDTADITLAELGWTNLFASVITGDEAPKPKPAPDGILMAAHQIGVPPTDCIFVGDAPADIQAGKASGATTVWASWHPVYREQIKKLEPDIIASTPADVVALFNG
jgi:phosphoglycolate phosphatase/pyrophosphatase PpaX